MNKSTPYQNLQF